MVRRTFGDWVRRTFCLSWDMRLSGFFLYIMCVVVTLVPGSVKAVDKCEAIFSRLLLGAEQVHSEVRASTISEAPIFSNEFVSIRDITKFVLEEKIMSDSDFKKLSDQVQAFAPNGEEIGNVLLLKVVDRFAKRPGPALDAIYKRFYRKLFLSYLTNFEKRIEEAQLSAPIRIQPLFGLDQLLLSLEINPEAPWTEITFAKFNRLAKKIFEQNNRVNLVLASQLVVQMNYLHARSTGDPLASSKEAEKASQFFLEGIQADQIFLPAAVGWKGTSMTAQWLSKTNINMIPLSFENSGVHGGFGSFEVMIHDQGHAFSRDLAVKEALRGKEPSVVKLELEVKNVLTQLEQALIATQIEMKWAYLIPQSRKDLTNGIFLFFHETENMRDFLILFNSGESNWRADSVQVQKLAKAVHASLDRERRLYPKMTEPSTQFENLLSQFIVALARNVRRT